MQPLWNLKSPSTIKCWWMGGFFSSSSHLPLWSRARKEKAHPGGWLPPTHHPQPPSHPHPASTYYWIHLADGAPYIEQGETVRRNRTEGVERCILSQGTESFLLPRWNRNRLEKQWHKHKVRVAIPVAVLVFFEEWIALFAHICPTWTQIITLIYLFIIIILLCFSITLLSVTVTQRVNDWHMDKVLSKNHSILLFVHFNTAAHPASRLLSYTFDLRWSNDHLAQKLKKEIIIRSSFWADLRLENIWTEYARISQAD